MITGVESLVERAVVELERLGHTGPFRESGTGASRILDGTSVVCLVHGSLSGPLVSRLQQAAGIGTIGSRPWCVVSLCRLTGAAGEFATAAGAPILVLGTDGSVVDRPEGWTTDITTDGGELPDLDGSKESFHKTADGTRLNEEEAQRWRQIIGIRPDSFYAQDLTLYHDVSASCRSCGSTSRTLALSEGEAFCECGAKNEDIDFCESCGRVLGAGDNRVPILNWEGYRELCLECSAGRDRCDQCGAVAGTGVLREVDSDPARHLCAATDDTFGDVIYRGCYYDTQTGRASQLADKRERREMAAAREADYRLDALLRERPRGPHR